MVSPEPPRQLEAARPWPSVQQEWPKPPAILGPRLRRVHPRLRQLVPVDLLVRLVHICRAALRAFLTRLFATVAEDLPAVPAFLQVHPVGAEAYWVVIAVGT